MVDITQKPYFHHSDILDSLMNPIQTVADINFNNLVRIFINGERFLVSNHQEESVDFAAKQLYKYGIHEKHQSKNHKNISSCFRMWDHLPYAPREIFQYKSQRFQMAHGLTIVRQHGDFCDFFSFSTQPGNSQINNFYLDEKELFNQFIDSFYISMDDKLKDLSFHTFIIPENTNYITHALLTLSPRQQDCARLLADGINTKEIARVLQLSPRTIETHVDILKTKFQAKNRVQLISLLNGYV